MSETFTDDWIRWHREREATVADPHGFLAITGQHWLTAERVRYPDAPGEWITASAGVSVTLATHEQLAVDGELVHDTYEFGVIPERASVFARSGDAIIEIAKRGGRDVVRPRHPGRLLLAEFTGVPAYPPDERW